MGAAEEDGNRPCRASTVLIGVEFPDFGRKDMAIFLSVHESIDLTASRVHGERAVLAVQKNRVPA